MFDPIPNETRQRLFDRLFPLVQANSPDHDVTSVEETPESFEFGDQVITGDIAKLTYLSIATICQLIEHPFDTTTINQIQYIDDTGCHVLLDPHVETPKKLTIEVVENVYDGYTLNIRNLE